MLLSRVAERIYWAARYVERAEDTARIVRSFTDLVADLPAEIQLSWEPLVAIAGSDSVYRGGRLPADDGSSIDVERAVVHHLVVDPGYPGSVRACVAASRENLRTTREVLPREGWEALNHLYHFTERESDRGLHRPQRNRFLTRVLSDSRRLDGILATIMTHDEAYVMWRLGRALERADMTTRVLGVRAAALLADQQARSFHEPGDDGAVSRTQVQSDSSLAASWQDWAAGIADAPDEHAGVDDHDAILWMGVLRSLSALQMYHRATRRPIDGSAVVEFLLFHERFPRAVRCCLRELGMALRELPEPTAPLGALDAARSALEDAAPAASDGKLLDESMDRIQLAIAELDRRIEERYLRVEV